MSNNAVFCISNNNKTVRLTVYRCKPNVFLKQLETTLCNTNNFDIDELVMAFIENGFDLDAETSASFTPADMCTSSLVNWAWLLDTESKMLSYWDVTAALNGLLETIKQDSISPLEYSNWLGSDAVEDYKSQVRESENMLDDIGVIITNF
ncbi:MAG: hypothetical protein ACC657_16600 [Thiohalomonadales bacterium]